MTNMKLFDASNVNYKACLSYGTVFIDGFRNDLFLKTFHPEYFGPEPTAPESERAQFLAQFARSQARKAKLEILSGAAVLALATEDDDEEATACCYCNLPEGQKIQLSLWQWIKYKAYSLYVPVAQYFDGNASKTFLTPQVATFFGKMYSESGAKEGPEYYAKLTELSRDELAKARYPVKETLYVHILSVRSDCHGKGYGSKLLLYAIDKMQYLKGPVFTSGTKESVEGPAKVSLFPTEGNEAFYNKWGFQTVSTGVVPLKDDKTFEHKFMQRFLHNEI